MVTWLLLPFDTSLKFIGRHLKIHFCIFRLLQLSCIVYHFIDSLEFWCILKHNLFFLCGRVVIASILLGIWWVLLVHLLYRPNVYVRACMHAFHSSTSFVSSLLLLLCHLIDYAKSKLSNYHFDRHHWFVLPVTSLHYLKTNGRELILRGLWLRCFNICASCSTCFCRYLIACFCFL